MEMAEGLEADLSKLEDLGEDNIRARLKNRYERDLIYTGISDILIAINPNKPLPLYTAEAHNDYSWDNFNTSLQPHVFQVAAAAYRRMRETATDQVIIVSGESGAGKTESTKYMVKHIVHMCQKEQMDLHSKIVEVNPLLESFGNAKTTMNPNSSRFAKYLELVFQTDGQISGAIVRDYILEKSRVVHRSQGEGNFHIFYELLLGCPRVKLEDLFLTAQIRQYRIMQSDDESLDMEEFYRKRYKFNMAVLKRIGVDTEVIHTILAAIINITEIEFQENDKGEPEIVDMAPFVHAAILLNLAEDPLGKAMITSKRVVRGQEIVSYKTLQQACDTRDSLAKVLYERMFGWLVRMVNTALHPSDLRHSSQGKIAILDIAGFEKLRDNSIEQMCINLVNERLQNFMNLKIFKMEMDIYQSQGISLEGIDLKNNDETIALFEQKPGGILHILDETTNFLQATDDSFVMELKKKYSGKSNLFTELRGDRPEFFIQHFAAQVKYNASGFLEKNRDRLNDELMLCMKKSNDEFISDLFIVKKGPTGTISATVHNYRKSRHGGVKVFPDAGKHINQRDLRQSIVQAHGKIMKPAEGFTQIAPKTKHETLVSYFRGSLLQLLGKLHEAEPYFVRCLKANTALSPGNFDEVVVADQLKYNGLCEIAKIRKMGWAVRKQYDAFGKTYQGLLPEKKRKSLDAKELTTQSLLCLPSMYHRQFRCGKTMVFMTAEMNTWLEHFHCIREKWLTRIKNRAAKTITRCIRAVAEKKKEEKRKILERKRAEEEKKRLEELKRLQKSDKPAPDSPKPGKGPAPPPPVTPGIGHGLSGRPNGQIGWSHSKPPEDYPGSSTGSSTGSSYRSSTGDPSSDHSDPPRPPSPPVTIDTEHRPEKEKEPIADTTKDAAAFWDICQVIARERPSKDVHEERSLQVIKVITYALLLCMLLFCAVSHKISLMVLASYQYDRSSNNNRTESTAKEDSLVAAGRHVLMAVVIVIPYCLIFISSLFKWMFGNLMVPRLSTFLLCFVVESLHSFGLCILCFLLLPEMDMMRGIMVLSAVGMLPAVLHPICSSPTKIVGDKQKPPMYTRIGSFILSALTILVQWGYLPLILLDNYFLRESTVDNETREIILCIVSFICISVGYWENFVDDRFFGVIGKRSWWKQVILAVKFDLQESRPVVSFFMSFFKIGFTLLYCWIFKDYIDLLKDKDIDLIHLSDIVSHLGDLPIEKNSSVLFLTITAFVGHYIGYTACKLHLQRFSFCIPLVLSTPIAVVIAALDCGDLLNLGVFTAEVRYCPEDHRPSPYHYLAGSALLMTIYWIGRHVFFPAVERLAKTERLFLNPYYCGVLFEEHLVLNRRRHNRKIYKEYKEDKVTYILSSFDTKTNIDDEEVEMSSKNANVDEKADSYYNPKFRDAPMIYACATMWHENKLEMMQILKSLFRMDRDQCLRRTAELMTGEEDKEFYDFEAHILFDDAMELNDDEEMVPNQFVKLMMSVINDAVSSVYEKHMILKPPVKVPSPYGGQLIWDMPGGNFLFLHMKDKSKIRHRKRWSQVMYMYYLLGFRIVRHCQETVTKAMELGQVSELGKWLGEDGQTAGGGRSHIFQLFDESVIRTASNTFLLALDGDVDFTPGAVRLLVDRMRKSEKVGAACGRIHPIGTGPVVWFQKFEYAIAHWLQKATEHVLGCVLCSPGCFSMFRGSALMDDNVMKRYTVLPTEAVHHLMYDQGEDRWLCTLLLQQGYRVDYAAGSDAFTYAPEGFGEFFNQRRRWMPSTVANIVDLLADYKNTVYINSNISMLYIFYQASLLVSTILGPATIIMMIAGASLVVFKVNLYQSYLIAIIPAVVYFIFCFFAKTKHQLLFAEILTGFYAFVMMIVLVGTIVTAAQESPFNPSVIFIAFLVFLFGLAAILHPKEWTCVIFGSLYFLLIPTGFLLLIFYSLCNMHIVSWGTREVPKKKTLKEIEEEKRKEEEKKQKKKEQGIFGRFFPQSPVKELKDLLGKITTIQGEKKEMTADSETTKILREINTGIQQLATQKDKPDKKVTIVDMEQAQEPSHSPSPTLTPHDGILKSAQTKGILKKSVGISDSIHVFADGKPEAEEVIYDKVKKRKRNDLLNPAWSDCKELGQGPIMPMLTEELDFWQRFIKKYLTPLDLSADQKKTIHKGLVELRNNVCLGMAMINVLWIAINFMFQLNSPTKISLPVPNLSSDDVDTLEEEDDPDSKQIDNLAKVDALGMLFIFFFLIILLLQFAGMLMHRWGTFLHLVSVTQLRNPFSKFGNQDMQQADDAAIDTRQAIRIQEQVLKEPLPDYSDDDDDFTAEDMAERKKQIENLQKTGSRAPLLQADGRKVNFGASTRNLSRSASGETLRNTMQNLRQSARVFTSGLQASRRFTTAPDMDTVRRRLAGDKYRDRPLPPVEHRRRRLNLGPGRSGLDRLIEDRNIGYARERQSRLSPLVAETDPEDHMIYDIISQAKGTMSRQLGRRMQKFHKATREVQFRNTADIVTDRPSEYRRRPNSMPNHDLVPMGILKDTDQTDPKVMY